MIEKMKTQKGALAAMPAVNSRRPHFTPSDKLFMKERTSLNSPGHPLGFDEAGPDPANPLHWMPVPFPGLSIQQLVAQMERIDSKAYTAPQWLAMRRSSAVPAFLESSGIDPDRDPNNPLDWMPVPPPAGFFLAVGGESSADGNSQ